MPRCISPLTLRQKGMRNIVPCGRCLNCLETKRDQWSFRIRQEMKQALSAKFLTLTYSDETVPVTENGELELDKKHMQLFMKKLRKIDAKHHRRTNRTVLSPIVPPRGYKWPPIRYYTVGEYGTNTHRPHYHSIMFNLHRDTVAKLSDIWGRGNVQAGSVNPASIHYVTKYVINRVGDYSQKQKPFAQISQGLGRNYLDNAKWHKDGSLKTYVVQDGMKMTIPRYYKDKLFDDGEKRYLTNKAILSGQESERKELKRLKKLHHNPLSYLNEREHENYQLKEKRVNLKNKF